MADATPEDEIHPPSAVDLESRAQSPDDPFPDSVSSQRPPGARGEDLREVTGALDPDSAREMRDAIADGCDQVDLDSW